MRVESAVRLALVGLAFLSVVGCAPRFKGVESYYSATVPNEQGTYVMDPGSYGGTAEASGGVDAGVSYGTGSSSPDDGNKAHYEEMAKIKGDKPADWTGGTAYEEDKPPAE